MLDFEFQGKKHQNHNHDHGDQRKQSLLRRTPGRKRKALAALAANLPNLQIQITFINEEEPIGLSKLSRLSEYELYFSFSEGEQISKKDLSSS